MIPLLNHGHLQYVDHMGDDLSIVRNARVSYDAAWRTGENKGSDAKLIRYLMNNGHNTPFEAVTVTVGIKAPIFVFRQWHRHRTQSYNELSARYRPLPEEYYVPDPWVIGVQNKDNKQMRDTITEAEFLELPKSEQRKIYAVVHGIRSANKISYDSYKNMLANGIPRELARSVLPMGMYSHMFATANLHNWFGFLRERLHQHAQYEIRVYAEAMLCVLYKVAPVATEAFLDTLSYPHDLRLDRYAVNVG
jgi:thymidylate synthase (FAD)